MTPWAMVLCSVDRWWPISSQDVFSRKNSFEVRRVYIAPMATTRPARALLGVMTNVIYLMPVGNGSNF